MKVYLLWESFCGDPFCLYSIHKTKKGAEEAKKKAVKKDKDKVCSYYVSGEWKVEEE